MVVFRNELQRKLVLETSSTHTPARGESCGGSLAVWRFSGFQCISERSLTGILLCRITKPAVKEKEEEEEEEEEEEGTSRRHHKKEVEVQEDDGNKEEDEGMK